VLLKSFLNETDAASLPCDGRPHTPKDIIDEDDTDWFWPKCRHDAAGVGAGAVLCPS